MRLALGIERRALPVGRPRLQHESSVARRSIELARGAVVHHPRSHPDAGLGDIDVLSSDHLVGAVVLRDGQYSPVDGDVADRHPAIGHAVNGRNKPLDGETAAGTKACGHGGEARFLRRRVGEIEECVERGKGDGVGATCKTRVGHIGLDKLEDFGARLGSECGEHRRRCVDAGDSNPTFSERERESAGPDTELKNGPAVSEGHHRVHRCLDVADVGVPVVVDVSETVAVAGCRVALHSPSLPVDAQRRRAS